MAQTATRLALFTGSRRRRQAVTELMDQSAVARGVAARARGQARFSPKLLAFNDRLDSRGQQCCFARKCLKTISLDTLTISAATEKGDNRHLRRHLGDWRQVEPQLCRARRHCSCQHPPVLWRGPGRQPHAVDR